MTNWTDGFTALELQHLYPVFVLVGLTFLVYLILFVMRVGGALRGTIRFSYFKVMKTPDGKPTPLREQYASRNLTNLFELPVLFYAAVLLMLMFHYADETSLLLCWIFAGSRVLHSVIHITINHVNSRFAVFGVSYLSLAAIWLRFFLDFMGL